MPFIARCRPHFFSALSALVLLFADGGCAQGEAETETGTAPDAGNGAVKIDDTQPPADPPHALGTILLAETHASDASLAYPVVSATFVPDAAEALSCKTKLDDSCELVVAAKCGTSGCKSDEVCAFDKSCAPKCQNKAVCTLTCEAEETCTVDKTGKAACTKIETFDAGPLAFSGTTTGIALFPPYQFEADGKGAPFLPGAEIKVLAQGAIDVGFEKFEATFVATSFIQTKPKLDKLSRSDVFGSGALPIAWVSGNDSILVTITGIGGSVTCKGDDSKGTLDVPRKAIEAALGDSTTSTTPTLALSISRQRKETKKGHKTKGSLSLATVQTEAWLELVTTSTETATIRGCASSATSCVD